MRLERWLSLAKAQHIASILKAGYLEISFTGNHWLVSRCFVKGGISISVCYALVCCPIFRLISAFFAVFLTASTMGKGWFLLASVACARPSCCVPWPSLGNAGLSNAEPSKTSISALQPGSALIYCQCAELSPFGPVYRALTPHRVHEQTGESNFGQTCSIPNGFPLWSAVSLGLA